MGVRGPRNLGPERFVKAWLGDDIFELVEASLKEASRQITELENWMKEQKKYDVWMMADEYEETLFPMIRRAIQYRYKIYNANKSIKEKQQHLTEIGLIRYNGVFEADFDADSEVIEIRADLNDLETEQMALVWKIKKIHTMVRREVAIQIAPGEVDPFVEYEYDPETS